jgi:prepilin-type N-terminal cleavage/methylation domain-containing protein
MGAPRRPARAGFTLVEVLLAVVLLSFMVLGFQAATGTIIHYGAQSDREGVAVQVARDRLDVIRLDPRYDVLESAYSEQAVAVQSYPGLERTTLIERTYQTTTTGVLDYHTITVRVTGDGLRQPVSRTIVVAAP